MQSDRELMQQALDALESCVSDWDWNGDGDEYMVDRFDEDKVEKALTALRERLAQPEFDAALQSAAPPQTVVKLGQPEQEPVAWNLRYNRYPREGDLLTDIHLLRWRETLPQSLNTAPRREWVGLTEAEELEFASLIQKSRHWLVYAIEAKLREKNA